MHFTLGAYFELLFMFSFEIFYGIWTSIEKKNYIFVIFQGGGGGGGGSGPPVPPSGSAHD